ncbi:MAG: hypothetical protein ACPKOI_12215 [Pleomorphochaeta sp.]
MGNNDFFNSLSPKCDVNLGVYEEALNFVFNSEDIYNIAISGPYCSGKSSVIRTYEKRNRKRKQKFLYISLANFINDENKKDPKEHKLEEKILNQILHQVKFKQINNNKIELNQKLTKRNIFFNSLLVIIFLCSLFFIANYNVLNEIFYQFNNEILDYFFILLSSKYVLPTAIIIFFICFCIIIGKGINFFKKTTFSKIFFQGNGFEISDKESIFDKYLDEVLFLLINSKYKVFVFEDLDRYNNKIIFQKLRELNILVNNKLNSNNNIKKNKIRFIYLMKDNYFLSKDRTKFFDFIIPIVPIIDSSNSYDQLLEILHLMGLDSTLDENKFLRNISLYIDDMRLLKNICNEFYIYEKQINKIELDSKKLFSLIIYKNIFPKDFEDTQLNKGFISILLSESYKFEFIEEITESIKERISKIEELIKKINNEHLRNIDELEIIYPIQSKKRNQNIKTYEERKNLINNKSSFENLKEEHFNLKKELNIINSKMLYQLIDDNNSEGLFSEVKISVNGEINEFSDVKDNFYFDLLKYLIREGYIDETYKDYMTYFYSNSLSSSDKIFVRSVLDKKPKDFNYNLNNPELIVKYLTPYHFSSKEILNYELFNYLLLNNEKDNNKELFSNFVNLLKNQKQFNFIIDYINKYKDSLESFIVKVNKIWPTFIETLFNNCEKLTKDLLKEMILNTIYFSSNEIINEVNDNKFLTKYINNDSVFLDINSPNIDRIISSFKLLNIKFISFNYENINFDLFKIIEENCFYDINMKNIKLIQKNIYNYTEDEINKINCEKVFVFDNNSSLKNYMLANINIYITELLNNSVEIFDKEETVIFILNNNEITDENKIKYCELLKTKIQKINLIDDKKFLDYLIVNNMENNQFNILYYFEKTNTLNELLIDYIQKNIFDYEFDFNELKNTFNETFVLNFIKAVYLYPFSYEKYLEIIKCINYIIEPFTLNELKDEQIETLIKNNLIKMNRANYKFIFTKYKSCILYFILSNKEYFLKDVLTPNFISVEVVNDILTSNNFLEEEKIKVLENTSGKISVKNILQDSIIEFILQNNFIQNELEYLVRNYKQYSEMIKLLIINLCVKNKKSLLFLEKFNENLFIDIINKDNHYGFTISELRQLLLKIIIEISKENCIIYLKKVNLNSLTKVFKNKRFFIIKNENIIIDFVNQFIKMNWVKNYESFTTDEIKVNIS